VSARIQSSADGIARPGDRLNATQRHIDDIADERVVQRSVAMQQPVTQSAKDRVERTSILVFAGISTRSMAPNPCQSDHAESNS
jgi:hypothetical protein